MISGSPPTSAIPSGGGHTRGPQDAAVKLIEFGDTDSIFLKPAKQATEDGQPAEVGGRKGPIPLKLLTMPPPKKFCNESPV